MPTTTVTPNKSATKKAAKKNFATKKDIAESYNRYKIFDGKQYTGMQVGRSHKWYYDKGEWKDTKITPDLWRISYAVTKRRAGKAPKGSGVPVGAGYHWYILAHQEVHKLNADDYSTVLTGLKFKMAHHRADKNKWSAKTPTQRKHLIQFLKTWLRHLQKEVVDLSFEFKGEKYLGEAVALPETESEGYFHQFDITLNDAPFGMIRRLKAGWKMDGKQNQQLVNLIGKILEVAASG